MSAYLLNAATGSPALSGRAGGSWLSGLADAAKEAWRGCRNASSPAERRHQMGLFLLYLSAAILPFGSLLLVLRWLYLRHHL